MGVKPLTVAIVAMALLVTSVTFEVIFHRDHHLDVRGPIGWQTIASSSTDDGYRGYSEPASTRAGAPIVANRSDTIQFQLRVDNGYPWAFSESYDVRYNGAIVAEGEINAASRSEGESTFSIPASTLYSGAGTKEPAAPDAARTTYFPTIEVQVASTYLYGTFQLQEAS